MGLSDQVAIASCRTDTCDVVFKGWVGVYRCFSTLVIAV